MKAILLLLVLVLLGAANPSLRARAEPHAEEILNPIYRWRTGNRIVEITRLLAAESDAGRRVPTTSEELIELLRRTPTLSGDTVDAWGTPFTLRRRGFTVRVGSAGPDRRFDTPDDLLGEPVAAAAR